MKRYPEYKDTGIEWLVEVPTHWEWVPLKAVSTCNDDVLSEATSADFEIEYVEISDVLHGPGIVGSTTMTFGEAPSRARRRVKDGDVIISTVRTYLKAISPVVCPPEKMVVSTGFAVIRPTTLNSTFLGYLATSEYVISEIISRSVGVSYPAINSSDVMTIKVPLPSREEQRLIAGFLDRETAKIDALIAEQEKLIALLKEKRQAVISYAVTKGLDSNAPMKDSGAEWLGEVPAHWGLSAIKRVGSIFGRIGYRGYTVEDLVGESEGAVALGGANLSPTGRLDLSKLTFLSWAKYEESPEIKVSRGDLLVGQRGTCGQVVIVDEDIGPATINPSLVVLKNLNLDGHFLCYFIMSEFVQNVFGTYLSTTAVPMLSQEQIGSVRICVPPEQEQLEIVAFLDRELARLEELNDETERAIALLQERRSALISTAVTGKIDVRGLVPQPAEAA